MPASSSRSLIPGGLIAMQIIIEHARLRVSYISNCPRLAYTDDLPVRAVRTRPISRTSSTDSPARRGARVAVVCCLRSGCCDDRMRISSRTSSSVRDVIYFMLSPSSTSLRRCVSENCVFAAWSALQPLQRQVQVIHHHRIQSHLTIFVGIPQHHQLRNHRHTRRQLWRDPHR